jgi:hypothetical protein
MLVLGTGLGCIISQIIAQIRREDVSGELVVAGVTLLTATPFLWKGDERSDAEHPGKHEARA